MEIRFTSAPFPAVSERRSDAFNFMTKQFRIWGPTGEPQTIEADSVEFTRVKGVGLTVKFKTAGQKPSTVKGVVALTEVCEEIKWK